MLAHEDTNTQREIDRRHFIAYLGWPALHQTVTPEGCAATSEVLCQRNTRGPLSKLE